MTDRILDLEQEKMFQKIESGQPIESGVEMTSEYRETLMHLLLM